MTDGRLRVAVRAREMAYSPCLDRYQHAKDRQLAKPNYEFAKRQRDLAKKQKKEEKKLRKALANEIPAAEEPPPAPVDDKAAG